MKNFLKNLPQILNILPQISKYIPMLLTTVTVLAFLAGVGFVVYYYVTTVYKDPFRCFEGEIYQRITDDSNVYVYKGGACIETRNPSMIEQIKQGVNNE